ncbi:MAG: DUF503 domain-containing protein [Longimicrobiales bacterium]
MVVGSISWQLSLPGCGSLKEKRAVVRSLKDRLRHRFNISVAETAHQDVLTRAELSAAVVSADGRFVESVLDKLDHFVETEARAVIVGTRRELF